MRVRSIRADGFTGWRGGRPLALELPEAGVVLVTGPNGGGKSSIVEAVAFALWGRTLRGSPPWVDGQALSVEVVFWSGLEVRRSVSARGKKELSFRAGESEWSSHPTTTKAQEELEQVVGTFDGWRRTSVFSSSDVDALTRSTDAERKRLLEQIVGISRFDEALAEVRAEIAEATREGAVAAERLSSRRRLEEAVRSKISEIDAAGSFPDDGSWWWRWRTESARVRLVEEEVRLAQQARELASSACEEARAAAARADQIARDAGGRAQSVSSGECPTCGQGVRGVVLHDLKCASSDARELATAAAQVVEQARLGQREAIARVDRAAARLDSAKDRARRFRSRWQAVDAEEAEAAEREKRRAAALDELERVRAEIEALSSRAAGANLERLRSIERVFGLKGARATLVAGVATAVGDGARLRLERLLPGASLRSGITAKGELSIAVENVGGGHGYDAASQGERRRIDVPLLLSLSEVAAAVRGEAPGTLWLDEALDSLDRAGVDGVVEIVEEVAASRPVVLISHRADLVEGLRATAAGRFDVG